MKRCFTITSAHGTCFYESSMVKKKKKAQQNTTPWYCVICLLCIASCLCFCGLQLGLEQDLCRALSSNKKISWGLSVSSFSLLLDPKRHSGCSVFFRIQSLIIFCYVLISFRVPDSIMMSIFNNLDYIFHKKTPQTQYVYFKSVLRIKHKKWKAFGELMQNVNVNPISFA